MRRENFRRVWFPLSVLPLLGLLCLPQDARPQPGSVTLGFASDPTWLASTMNADGSVGTSVGPAQNVCQLTGWPCLWGANLSTVPGSFWIWLPGVSPTSPADLQGAYFSKTINLPGEPLGGYLRIAADDFAEVRVNGLVAGSIGSVSDYNAAAAAQSSLREFDLSPFLTSGSNTIEIRSQNGPAWYAGGRCNPCAYAGNEAGVVFGGQLRSTGGPPSSDCAAHVVFFSPGVVDFGFGLIDPVQCAAVAEPLDASCMTGAPDWRFCSIGELGSVTLSFEVDLIDGPGNDVEVWGSCNAHNEPSMVLVSQDGINFVALGRFDDGVSMGFDLGAGGLSSAMFLRVEDLPGGVYPEGSGTDLDAVCALNTGTPVLSRGTTWGQLKVRYR